MDDGFISDAQGVYIYVDLIMKLIFIYKLFINNLHLLETTDQIHMPARIVIRFKLLIFIAFILKPRKIILNSRKKNVK